MAGRVSLSSSHGTVEHENDNHFYFYARVFPFIAAAIIWIPFALKRMKRSTEIGAALMLTMKIVPAMKLHSQSSGNAPLISATSNTWDSFW